MISRKIQPGDVLRLKSLYVRGTGRVHGNIWVVVDHQIGDGSYKCDVFHGPQEAWPERELDDSDDGRVVAGDKLPNYICAALAKWRLTEEKTVA